jgi:hypothetical protein
MFVLTKLNIKVFVKNLKNIFCRKLMAAALLPLAVNLLGGLIGGSGSLIGGSGIRTGGAKKRRPHIYFKSHGVSIFLFILGSI